MPRNEILETKTLQYFKYAFSHSPADIYEGAGQPTLRELPSLSARFVTAKALESGLVASQYEAYVPHELFKRAIESTQELLTHTADHANLSIDQLSTMARHKETARTLAALALRSNQLFDVIMRPSNLKEVVTTHDDHIGQSDRLMIPDSYGCPFAHTGDRHPNPPGVFRKAVSYTGALMKYAHDTHGE